MQIPNAFYNVVCTVSELELDNVVALEATTELTPVYRDYINSRLDAANEIRSKILAIDNWSVDITFQDGRRSIAVLNLLGNLRKQNLKNQNIKIISFDQPTDNLNEHDKGMEKQILRQLNSDHVVLVLTGSVHSMLEHGSPWKLRTTLKQRRS